MAYYTGLYTPDDDKPWLTGQPQWYDIQPADGGTGFRVHESRCLVFTNGKLVSRSSFQEYRYWGIPEYYRIRKPLNDSMKTTDMAPKMMEKSTIPIFKSDLRGTLSTAEGRTAMTKRMRLLNRLAGWFNFVGIDKSSEDVTFAQATLTGTGEVNSGAKDDLVAHSGLPRLILFGEDAKGLNATGEGSFENWYSLIRRIQQNKYKTPLETLLDMIAKALLFKGKITEIPDIKLEFNELWTLSDKEQAEVDHQKAQTEHTKAQTAAVYCNEIGSVDASEVRAGLADDEAYKIEDLVDDKPKPFANLQKFLQEFGAKALKKGAESGTINLDEQPRDEQGRFAETDGGKATGKMDYSATGANPNIKGFREKDLADHFGAGGKSDHSEQYRGFTKEQYAQRALSLAQSPVGEGIEGYKATHGLFKDSIVRYDTSTNDWVRAMPDGRIPTMFQPEDKAEYFERINRRETRS